MPIQLPPDSTGKLIETVVVTSSENREVVILGSTTLAYAPVTTSGGLRTNLSSGTVTLSSQPGPWSSAPGFNVPIVSVSSGLVQLSGTPLVQSATSGQMYVFPLVTPTSSVAGAGLGPVSSSAGILGSLSSGTVSLSSQISVTSTAATNPWSSAPGFNLPVVSVSSGLIQISGTVTVLNTSSGLVQISGVPAVTVQGSSGGTVLVTTSGAMSVTISTAAGAASTTVNVQGSTGTVAIVTSSGALLVSGTPGSVSTAVNIIGATTGIFAPVTSSFGLLVNSTQTHAISSGLISITSGTITSTSATNPWSSAPGFNVPVVTVSSGLLQAFQTGTWTIQTTAGTAIATSSGLGVPIYQGITPTSSVAGAGLGPVTSSAGVLTNLSSGTVTLSSAPLVIVASSGGTQTVIMSSVQTVTATAATNPWSSAPGFNVPVVTVSSGLVQISGTPLINVVGTSSGVAVVTTSGGLLVSLSSTPPFQSTAATNPWSSAPGFNVPVVSVSSGLIQSIAIGVVSSLGYVSTYFQSTGGAASVNVRGSASSLVGYSLFNSTAAIRSVKIYNTTSAPAVGSTTNVLLILLAPGSTGGGGANLMLPPPGLFASNGIGFTMTANVAGTDTGAPGSNDLTLNLYII